MLGLVSAGIGLASGIMGGIKSGKAAKKQEQLINSQEAKNEAWYNRNYYQNYLDSSESRAAIKRVEDTMKKRNQEAQATAAVTGGTPESVLAQQENDQKLMSDTIEGLAARADARKEQIDAVNQQNQQNIANARMGQQQMNEAGGAQLMGIGLGSIVNGLSSSSVFDKRKMKINRKTYVVSRLFKKTCAGGKESPTCSATN